MATWLLFRFILNLKKNSKMISLDVGKNVFYYKWLYTKLKINVFLFWRLIVKKSNFKLKVLLFFLFKTLSLKNKTSNKFSISLSLYINIYYRILLNFDTLFISLSVFCLFVCSVNCNSQLSTDTIRYPPSPPRLVFFNTFLFHYCC